MLIKQFLQIGFQLAFYLWLPQWRLSWTRCPAGLHGLDPICMTEHHCLKVEPASLLTITEHSASPEPPEQQAHTRLEPPRATHTLHHSFTQHVSALRVRYTQSCIEPVSSSRIRYVQSWSSACMRYCSGSWHINSLLCSMYKTVHPAGQGPWVAIANTVARTRCSAHMASQCFDQLYTLQGMTDSTHHIVFCIQACMTAAPMKRLTGHSHRLIGLRRDASSASHTDTHVQ